MDMIIDKFLTGKKGNMKAVAALTAKDVREDSKGDSYIIAITKDTIDAKNKTVIGGGLEFIRGTKADLLSIKAGFIYNKG